MLHQTRLSFGIIDTDSCKYAAFVDQSFYNEDMTVTGGTLQVITPGSEDAIELSYVQNGVTLLNSNSLGLSNVVDIEDLLDLPDGLYIGKISICPYDQFWYEKTWYRTCLLECKYNKGVLELDLNKCTTCYSEEKAAKLAKAWMYIQGIHANAEVGNYVKCHELYEVADKMLTQILECGDCK